MKLEMSPPARRLMTASGVALIAAITVVWLLGEQRDTDISPVKTIPVLVAKTYVATQSPLDSGCCYEKRIPEIYAPPRPLSKKDLASSHLRARGEILKGEIVTASRVGDAASASAGWDIGDDETAVTVHLTPEGAMAGIISPGDTVNVMATFEKRCCLLVADARVLAVGKHAGRGPEEASASDETLVTLKLEPRDAMRTILASQKQVLSLALVSPLNAHTAPGCVAIGDL